MHLYVKLYLCVSNCIQFCIFSCFHRDRAKFNKYAFILAISYVHFFVKIQNYVIHIKIYMYFHCVFFHNIHTVAQNTQMAHMIIVLEWYSIYLVIFSHLHLPLGCL